MMQPTTIDTLLAINRMFYQQLAQPFAESRSMNQPGFLRVAQSLCGTETVLDVGCGNGRLVRALDTAGFRGRYIGIDASHELLALAAQSAAALTAAQPTFLPIDISRAGWESGLPLTCFDAIALLAVLHHIPGRDRRLALLRALGKLLTAGGILVVSTWQFLNEERLRRKIMPWNEVGLDDSDLEPGDYLLDWHRGGSGLRYCHLVDEAELAALAAAAGLVVTEVFYADGVSQNLNLFALLRPAVSAQQPAD